MGHVDGDLAFNPSSDDGAGGNDLPPRPQMDLRKGAPGKVGASGVDPERGEDLDERVVGDRFEVAVVPPIFGRHPQRLGELAQQGTVWRVVGHGSS